MNELFIVIELVSVLNCQLRFLSGASPGYFFQSLLMSLEIPRENDYSTIIILLLELLRDDD